MLSCRHIFSRVAITVHTCFLVDACSLTSRSLRVLAGGFHGSRDCRLFDDIFLRAFWGGGHGGVWGILSEEVSLLLLDRLAMNFFSPSRLTCSALFRSRAGVGLLSEDHHTVFHAFACSVICCTTFLFNVSIRVFFSREFSPSVSFPCGLGRQTSQRSMTICFSLFVCVGGQTVVRQLQSSLGTGSVTVCFETCVGRRGMDDTKELLWDWKCDSLFLSECGQT